MRGDYVDGELVVSAAPNLRHQEIANNLDTLLRAQVPPGTRVIQGWGWKVGGDEFVPDVMVFDADSEDQARFTGTPHLAVEILSTDRGRDLLRRARKYAAAGVRHYWVVAPDGEDGPEVVEHRLGAEGAYVPSGPHSGDDEVALGIGVATVRLIPAELAG